MVGPGKDQRGQAPAGVTRPEFRLGHILLGLHSFQSQASGLVGGNISLLQTDLRVLGHLPDHRRGPPNREFRRLRKPRPRPGLANLERELNRVRAVTGRARTDRVGGRAVTGGRPARPLQGLREDEVVFPVLVRAAVESVAPDRERRIEPRTRLARRSRDPGSLGARDPERQTVLRERLEGLRQRDPAKGLLAESCLRKQEEGAKPQERDVADIQFLVLESSGPVRRGFAAAGGETRISRLTSPTSSPRSKCAPAEQVTERDRSASLYRAVARDRG